MVKIFVKKMEEVFISMAMIERYMLKMGWFIDANQYRSPHGGNIGIGLCVGEQKTVELLASFENRPSFNVVESIFAIDRNQPLPKEVSK
jgi:transcription termination factor Rho